MGKINVGSNKIISVNYRINTCLLFFLLPADNYKDINVNVVYSSTNYAWHYSPSICSMFPPVPPYISGKTSCGMYS